MALDTFITLYNRLLLRCPAVGPLFAQDLIQDSFKEFCQRRDWSWRQKSSALNPQTFSAAGTISISPGSATVTGSGTAFTSAMIGAQFRVSGFGYPTYSIINVASSTSLTLDRPWIGPVMSGSGYQIFQCYFRMPADFDRFISLINPRDNFQLHTSVTQTILDRLDPQRAKTGGQSYAASFVDFTGSYVGEVGSILQVRGSGPSPIATTTLGYTYPSASTYVITITTGGVVGVAEFTWRQDNGSTSAAILTSSDPTDLSNGIQVYFPDGTYVQGDVFVIHCTPNTVASVPRYELWPRPINASNYVYPYLYLTSIPDLSDDSPALPPSIANRGDVILELALMKCAEWPGAEGTKNPYYDLNLARRHQLKFEAMVNELELRDNDINQVNLVYTNLPFYPAPWTDPAWLQSHDVMPL